MYLLKINESDIAEIGILYPARFCYNELAEFYTQLSKLKSLAIKCDSGKTNNHYSLCPWSDKNCVCGPDMCDCILANFTFYDLKKKNIVHQAEIINKIKCLMHCNMYL